MNSWIPKRPLMVLPKPGESARGFVMRVAQRNRITFDQMCDWVGLPRRGTPFDVPAADAARMLGLDPEEFERMGFRVEDHEWVLGHRIGRRQLLSSRFRLCPACLSEDAFHRRIWDLAQVSVCPIHRAVLIDNCQCGRALRWSRSSIAECACGASLASAPAPQSTDCIGAAAVCQRCGIIAGNDLHEAFRSLPLADLLELLFFFGRADIVLAQGNPDRLAPMEMVLDNRVLNAGARVALRWPEGFHDLADRVRQARNVRDTELGLLRHLGYVHRFVARCDGKSYAAALRSVYAQYIASRPDVLFRGVPKFLSAEGVCARYVRTSEDVRTSKYVRISEYVRTSEALTISGLGAVTFQRARRSTLWEGVRTVKGANGFELHLRQDVLAFSEKVRRLISYRVAEAAFDLPKGGIKHLVDASILQAYPVNRSRAVVNHSVDRADIEALVGRVAVHAKAARDPAAPVSFSELVRMAATRKMIPFADLFRSLLDGRLRPYIGKPEAMGMARFLFESRDVELVLNELVGVAMKRLSFSGKPRRHYVWGREPFMVWQMQACSRDRDDAPMPFCSTRRPSPHSGKNTPIPIALLRIIGRPRL